MDYRKVGCGVLAGSLLVMGGCGGSTTASGTVTGTPVVTGAPLAAGGAGSVYVSQLGGSGAGAPPAGVLAFPATASGTFSYASSLPIFSGYVPADIAIDSTGQIYTGLTFYQNYTMPTFVAVYAAGATGAAAPLRIVNGGAAGFAASGPGPLAIDAAGLLYALQAGGVSVYAANASGAAAAVRTIKVSDAASTNGNALVGLAVDKAGTLYTAGFEAGGAVIYALPATASGTVTPSRVITGLGSVNVQAIDTDSAGNLYVMTSTGSTSIITEFGPAANGAATALRTIAPPATLMSKMKVDVAGNVYGVGYMLVGTNSVAGVFGFGPAASGAVVPGVTIFFTAGIAVGFAVK